jgi:hypothetical protein
MGKTVIESSDQRSQIVKKILAGISGWTDQPKKYYAVEYSAGQLKVTKLHEADR